ncbi:hypothetical protein GCM10011297_23100 [Bacterioplanes sanyensis]|nr:hypothetical protein GCM10011297_23100 [Bacterioplanes sanyensis]
MIKKYQIYMVIFAAFGFCFSRASDYAYISSNNLKGVIPIASSLLKKSFRLRLSGWFGIKAPF